MLTIGEYRLSRAGTCRQPDSKVSQPAAKVVSHSKFSSTS